MSTASIVPSTPEVCPTELRATTNPLAILIGGYGMVIYVLWVTGVLFVFPKAFGQWAFDVALFGGWAVMIPRMVIRRRWYRYFARWTHYIQNHEYPVYWNFSQQLRSNELGKVLIPGVMLRVASPPPDSPEFVSLSQIVWKVATDPSTIRFVSAIYAPIKGAKAILDLGDIVQISTPRPPALTLTGDHREGYSLTLSAPPEP